VEIGPSRFRSRATPLQESSSPVRGDDSRSIFEAENTEASGTAVHGAAYLPHRGIAGKWVIQPLHKSGDTLVPAAGLEDTGVNRASSAQGEPSHASWLEQARSHLRDSDPVLARLIDERPDFDPRAWLTQLPPMDLYGALLFQIVGQQLSVPATRRTIARIEDLFGGHLPSPTELLAVDPASLRQAGLSWRKIDTLRDLAGRLSDGRLNSGALSGLPDDELIAELTTIPGIGPWTVQGVLIIALRREDVVLPGDLALRKAVQSAYGLDHLPSEEEMLAIAENWRPYRSLATSYLFSATFEGTPTRSTAPRRTNHRRTRSPDADAR
jgi:DNA-3-methyladenine glycosylase II